MKKLHIAHGVGCGWFGLYRMAVFLDMGFLHKVTGESTYERKGVILSYDKVNRVLVLVGEDDDLSELETHFGLEFETGTRRQLESFLGAFYGASYLAT